MARKFFKTEEGGKRDILERWWGDVFPHSTRV